MIKIIAEISPSKSIRLLLPSLITWKIDISWQISISHFFCHKIQITKVIWTVNNVFRTLSFNSIQDGSFRGCSLIGGGGKKPLPPYLKAVIDILQWWNLAQLYLIFKRSSKYMIHVTHPLSSADISNFSPEISKFCYIKKYMYRLHLDT